MKETLLALSAILAVSTAIVIINANDDKSPHLLGREECTWGPVFWCNNITTSATCDMTDHCIKKVWSNMEVPEDTDDVCTICKNMVKQARDQLESNETQNDIKMVMEGSCDLIPVRLVADECKRLVDEFIPQLVETLASQMNPSVVCSVAGLCNSARIDRLLAEEAAKNFLVDKRKFMLANDELEPSECVKCHTVMAHAKNKINDMPNDEIYLRMMGACGELSSFSDACAAIVTRYFKNIVKHVRTDFNGENICHLSGQCAAKYHQHEGDDEKGLKVNIRPLSSVGMVDVGDDLPCKLCEQLVGHLRDVLIANTTAIEFKDILEGFCTQTQSFAAECKEIVNKYYSEIYMYLIKGLNSNAVCTMCGLCPAPGKTEQQRISPLLPSEQHRMALQIMEHARKENIRAKSNIGQNFDSLKAEEKQLPIERLFPPFYGLAFPRKDVNGNNLCDLCEYVIHDVQETLTNPKTIEQIEKVVKNVCHKLPIVINNCDEFIDQYGAALISLLVQEADPAKVCPKLALCAPEALLQALETLPQNKMLQSGIKEKPGCPLCLLAVTDLENQIKSNKTRANIEAALSKLCSHLNKNLKQGCEDFVDSYSDELIDMLVADFSPEEVCVYLKLCNPKKHVGPPSTIMFPMNKDGEIISNEIPEYPLHPIKKTQVTDGPICTVCELVMGYVDKEMRDESTREEFEKILHNACRVLPKKMSKECNDYVQEYGEMVLDILSKDISPKVVCQMIGICKYSMKYLEEEITECSVCNMVISTLDHMLDDPRIDDDIEQTVAKVCDYVPSNIHSQCVMKVKIYGQTMINLFKSHVDPQKMCSKMDLCAGITNFPMKASRNGRSTTDFGTRSCTWGQSYWCASEQNAVKCGMLTTCQELWKSKSAPTSEQIPTVTSVNNLD